MYVHAALVGLLNAQDGNWGRDFLLFLHTRLEDDLSVERRNLHRAAAIVRFLTVAVEVQFVTLRSLIALLDRCSDVIADDNARRVCLSSRRSSSLLTNC